MKITIKHNNSLFVVDEHDMRDSSIYYHVDQIKTIISHIANEIKKLELKENDDQHSH